MINSLKLIEKINKALTVEVKMGYKNAAVFGGFSHFVLSSLNRITSDGKSKFSLEMIRDLSAVCSAMGNYTGFDKGERETAVKHLAKVTGILMTFLSTSQKTASKDFRDEEMTQIKYLKTVGPKRLKLLNKLGILSLEDLLYHFPRRYEDRSQLKKFWQLQNGEIETVMGTVAGIQDIRPRRGLTITKAAIHDGASIGYAVWFNQPYIKKQIPPGTEILITGKVERKFGNIQISVADFEILDQEDPVHSGRIVPIYPTTAGLQPRALRSIIKHAVDDYADKQGEFLPLKLLEKYRLLDLPEALEKVHFPGNIQEVELARRRLIFEELFLLQIGVSLLRASEIQEAGTKHKINGPLHKQFLDLLPYSFTKAQERVLDEIYRDMESTRQMNRLIQGDVGSGKTVIAAAALVKTVESGNQGAMMAPTEILAGQHFEGLQELLRPLGIEIALLTGSINKTDKQKIISDIKSGCIDIVVGTHAVIQDEIEFQKLGLAVTDEQHRFGVKQRAALKKKGYNPDVLVMTATPIPRTLAMTVYGDLDISVIDELPPGRQSIKTYWINTSTQQKVYQFIREQVKEGRQVYYVCPLVEESEKLDVSAVVELAEFLQTKVFPDLSVGLMHGRLKQTIKDTVMKEFKAGNIDILVSTTVIEVGVNIPNASLMVIEDADRFGLAQLHQLRGRVGRGSYQSYCILKANPSTDEGKARMKIMQATSDGFVIAEEDLKLRGPGEFFGTRQSGMPDLKIADIIKDVKILQIARDEAAQIVKEDPGLRQKEHLRLREKVIRKFKNTDNYITIS